MSDFVNFELAQKLKEKGLNVPFYFYYRTDDKSLRHANVTNPLIYCDKIDDEVVIAPTISQVLKWFREEKGIHVCIALGEFSDWMYDVSRIDGNMFCKAEDGLKSYEQAALASIEYVLDNLI